MTFAPRVVSGRGSSATAAPGPERIAGRPRPPWFVVVGPGRSGSTILDRMLAERGALVIGELVHVWQRVGVENQLCGCGEPSQTCPFWSRVLVDVVGQDWVERCAQLAAESERHSTYRSLHRMLARPAVWRSEAGPLIETTAALVDAIERWTEPDGIIWDASKSATHARVLSEAGAEPTIVILTREPAAVAYSWTRPKSRPESGGELMPRRGVVGSSLRWSYTVISGLIEARRAGVRPVVLDYRSLGDTLDLPLGGTDDPWPHAIGGNPMRWNGGPAEFVPDDRWRTAMSTRARILATMIAAPGIVALAIARRTGWARKLAT